MPDFFSQMFFLQIDVAQRHLVAGWSQLQTQKGPEGEIPCLISILQELRFIFLLLLKCASLEQKFDLCDSTLLAVDFSIFFVVVLIVRNTLESRHCATLS